MDRDTKRRLNLVQKVVFALMLGLCLALFVWVTAQAHIAGVVLLVPFLMPVLATCAVLFIGRLAWVGLSNMVWWD